MTRTGPSQEEGRRGHLSFLGGGTPLPASPRGRSPKRIATVGAERRFRPQQHVGSPLLFSLAGGNAVPPLRVDIVDAMLMRAETLFRPYNSSVEVVASHSKFVFVSDTVCICVRYSLYLPCIQFVFASDTVCICRKYKVYTVAWRNFLR